jgi:hypothetical protein
MELDGGAERVVALRDLLGDPARYFPGLGGGGDDHA